MVEDLGKRGTRILVDLGGIKLPAAIEKQLQTDIRRVVLGALAGVDLRVDIAIVPRPRLPKGTIGIILRQGIGR